MEELLGPRLQRLQLRDLLQWLMVLEDIFPGEAKVHLLQLPQLLQELSICPAHQEFISSKPHLGQQIKVRAACFPFRPGWVRSGTPESGFRISTPDLVLLGFHFRVQSSG